MLTSNGIDPALIDFISLRLYHLGDEVAIAIHDDNANDGFDAADTIRFYAAPVAADYAKYAPQNVYWMTLSGGLGPPLRMAEVDGYHVYRKTAADAGYSRITAQPVSGTAYTDEAVSLGTRYYYAVRSVDADGLEGVDSEAVSLVIPVPTTSLSGTQTGGGVCFVSTTQIAYNQNMMKGLAFLGLVVVLWRLIMRIKAKKSGRRRWYAHGSLNSAFDEVTEFEFPVMTGLNDLGSTEKGGPVGKERKDME